ncbi:hypothetical protein BC938DRAFT_478082 [Jimgerdemannia flammicorona]|uniref:Uncharacterized protein n=1 Tax=Jimgerdemannia flammicorona TaxID=994334 RepID=A0A433QNF2_9FUNG|nr:hypothetical protein BC938DRAFT_478082 [Jimgerdemannia flammicorona]
MPASQKAPKSKAAEVKTKAAPKRCGKGKTGKKMLVDVKKTDVKAKTTASEIDDIFSGKAITSSSPSSSIIPTETENSAPTAANDKKKKKKGKSKSDKTTGTDGTSEASKSTEKTADPKLKPAKHQPEEVVFAMPGLPASATGKKTGASASGTTIGKRQLLAANDEDGFSDSRGKKSRMLF